MVIINLMPWRAQAQQYYREQVKKIIGLTLALAAFVYSIATWQLSALETNLKKQIVMLEDEIRWHDPQRSNGGDADAMMSSAALLNELKTISTTNKAVLAGLQTATQDGICFKEIKRTSQALTLAGEVSSSAELLAFVQRWREINLFSEVKVDSLKQLTTDTVSFRLLAVQQQSLMHRK